MPSILRIIISFLNLVFQSIEEGLIITNSQGEIVFLNFRTQELFGYTEAELFGQKVEFLIPRQHRKHHVDYRDGYVKKPTRKNHGKWTGIGSFKKKRDFILCGDQFEPYHG